MIKNGRDSEPNLDRTEHFDVPPLLILRQCWSLFRRGQWAWVAGPVSSQPSLKFRRRTEADLWLYNPRNEPHGIAGGEGAEVKPPLRKTSTPPCPSRGNRQKVPRGRQADPCPVHEQHGPVIASSPAFQNLFRTFSSSANQAAPRPPRERSGRGGRGGILFQRAWQQRNRTTNVKRSTVALKFFVLPSSFASLEAKRKCNGDPLRPCRRRVPFYLLDCATTSTSRGGKRCSERLQEMNINLISGQVRLASTRENMSRA